MIRRALLIGINRYRVPGADLRGCVNDVHSLMSVLVEDLAFTESEIVTLLDEQATKKAITTGVTRLVRASKPGDVAWVHFSGRGSNLPDKEGDEADYREEALCPHDLDWRDPLTLTYIGLALEKAAPGVELVVTLDCCFSGTNTRAIQAPDARMIDRYLPSPWDLVAGESGRALRGQRSSVGRSRMHSKTVRGIDRPWIAFQASLDTQTAADVRQKDTSEGAFTSALVWVLRQKRSPTYVALLAAVEERLKSQHFEQTPMLIGPAKRLKRRFLESSIPA